MLKNITNYTKEFKYNLKLSIPVMLGSLGHLMVGLVDDIMIGSLGPVELAASSLGNSIFFIALSLGVGFSFAITPLIAEADGKSNKEKGRKIFQHSFLLMSLMGIVLAILLYISKHFLHHMNQPEEVVELAKPYFSIIIFTIIPIMMFQSLRQFADGLSQTKYAMYAIVITNVVNILVNYMLIYGIWFFPRLELVGAAIGTLTSRVVMFLFMFLILKKKHKFRPFMKLIKRKDLHRFYYRKIINLGIPSSLQMLFEVGLFSASVLLAGTLGAFPQAANQIAIKLASVTFMIASGLSVATTIRVGNQKGLQRYKDLRRIAFSNFLLIFLIMFVFAILFSVMKNMLPWIFTENFEVVEIASGLLILAALFQLSDGLQVVIIGSLRGMQDVIIPTILTLIAYWFIGFPVSYYFGLHTNLGTKGIWIGLLTGLTASAALLFIRFNQLTKKLIQSK
ncbi:MATE family efflux transporter [Aureivirga marina]|uniref:MATE family efflux transporter n=1 Tax=Aureivirga marina TaxID=1182451 RepID=UPI0018CA664E|nr:MATE family efflux transporter [Aureivirga marina]